MESVTLTEASRRLGVSVEEVRNRIRRGELQARQVTTATGLAMGVDLPDAEQPDEIAQPEQNEGPSTLGADRGNQMFTAEEPSAMEFPNPFEPAPTVGQPPITPPPQEPVTESFPRPPSMSQPPPAEPMASDQVAPEIIPPVPDLSFTPQYPRADQPLPTAPPQQSTEEQWQSPQPPIDSPPNSYEPVHSEPHEPEARPPQPPSAERVSYSEVTPIPTEETRSESEFENIVPPERRQRVEIHPTDAPGSSGVPWSELVSVLQQQVQSLSEELAARRREVQELHVLLQQLQNRALPPPPEAPATGEQFEYQRQPQERPPAPPPPPAAPRPPSPPPSQTQSQPDQGSKTAWWKFRLR